MARTVGLVFKKDETEKATAEPTMAELKEKATALGLKFSGNISKANLTALIENAEKAAAEPEGEKAPEGTPELDPDGEE